MKFPFNKSSGKKKKKKSFEFSKLIYIQVSILTVVIIVYALVVMWITGDLTPLPYLITSVFAEFATATGFYYSKAKVENKIKLAKLTGLQVEKEDLTQY